MQSLPATLAVTADTTSFSGGLSVLDSRDGFLSRNTLGSYRLSKAKKAMTDVFKETFGSWLSPLNSTSQSRAEAMGEKQKEIIAEYAKFLGVTVFRVSTKVFNERSLPVLKHRATHVQPTFDGCAFNRPLRQVVADDRLEFDSYTPHEITHAIWPSIPRKTEEEWNCGMIPFELSWLWLLTGPNNEDVYRKFESYAREGKPKIPANLDLAFAAAKRATKRYNLPNPFVP